MEPDISNVSNSQANQPEYPLSITPERMAHFVLTQIVPNTALHKIPALFDTIQKKDPLVADALLHSWFGSEFPKIVPTELCWHIVHQYKYKQFEITNRNTIEPNNRAHENKIRQDICDKQEKHLKAFYKDKTTSVCMLDSYNWDSSISIQTGVRNAPLPIRQKKLKENSITEQENLELHEILPSMLQIFTKESRYIQKPMLVLQQIIETTPKYPLTGDMNDMINFEHIARDPMAIAINPIAYMDQETLYINTKLLTGDLWTGYKYYLLDNHTYQLKNIACTPIQNFGHHVAYTIKMANTLIAYDAGKNYLSHHMLARLPGIMPFKLTELAGILSYNDNNLMHEVLISHARTKSNDIYVDKTCAERVMKLPYDVRALFKTLDIKIHIKEQPKPHDPIPNLGIIL
jgi:hypothetical protein